MYSKVECAAVTALQVMPVAVEVDISDGMPVFDMVGLLAGEVRESRERVRTALRQTGIRLPPKRVTINLSPAALKKSGSGYDLAIAAGLLIALEQAAMPVNLQESILFYGELNLQGRVLPVRGVLSVACYAKETGKKWLFVPKENEQEAVLAGGAAVIGVSSVKELLYDLIHPDVWIRSCGQDSGAVQKQAEPADRGLIPDFSDVHGQAMVKRAAEIAAAGGHNLMLAGAPGTSKSMIASRIPGILPKLTEEESLEITKVYSIAGKLEGKSRIWQRPFRAPHHTCTKSGMAGGGREPLPGEITLAHKGVLFLDEFPEFSRSALEVLRQPMEEHRITIIRCGGEYCYPADFMLVAALNPCPCGYFPDTTRCHCTEYERKKYLSKLKGPLYDRMDLCVMTPRVSYEELTGKLQEESSSEIQERVEKAWEIQQARYRQEAFSSNARIPVGKIGVYASVAAESEAFLRNLYEKMRLGARGYHKIIRVARTIADLAGAAEIAEEHLAEAVSYRMPEEVQFS